MLKLNNLTFLDVINNLKNIENIKVNDKLIIYDDKFEIDNSYMQFFTRWVKSSGRQQTLTFIKKIIETSIYYSNGFIEYGTTTRSDIIVLKNNLILITFYLDKSIIGLTNLKTTYSSDDEFVFVINTILTIIITLIHNNKKNTKTMIKI